MTTYEEKFINNKCNPLQAQRLLKQGELNRMTIKQSQLKIATLQDLKVGLALFHYTNCGFLWSHIIRHREEEPPNAQGSTNYEEYKEYIKQGVIAGNYYILTGEVPSKAKSSKRRTSKSPT